jgi:hypothetical protein
VRLRRQAQSSSGLAARMWVLAAAAVLGNCPAQAQCPASPEEVLIRAGGTEVRLKAATTPRLPYGYQLVALARPPADRAVRRLLWHGTTTVTGMAGDPAGERSWPRDWFNAPETSYVTSYR